MTEPRRTELGQRRIGLGALEPRTTSGPQELSVFALSALLYSLTEGEDRAES